MMKVFDVLKNSTLFNGLTNDELEALAGIVSLKSLTKGKILFFDGDPALGFYVVFNGKIRVYKANPEGKEITIHIITAGQIFGEVAIFEGKKYPANSMALEESEVGFIPKADFLQLIKKYPDISLKIIGSLSRFLREYNQKIEDLALKEVNSRIAGYLLARQAESQNHIIKLDSSKAQIAASLGTISETFSRNLKKLKDQGIIMVDNQQISVLDTVRLVKIAEGKKS